MAAGAPLIFAAPAGRTAEDGGGPLAGRLSDLVRRVLGVADDRWFRANLLHALGGLHEETADTWLRRLSASGIGGDDWQFVLQRLTDGQTRFFRDPPGWRRLWPALNALVALRRQSGCRRLRAWSAGCATGEEVYTLTMLLLEILADQGEDVADWQVTVIGTDVVSARLDHARAGAYRVDGRRPFGEMPLPYMRHFDIGRDMDGNLYRANGALRSLVTFQLRSLIQDAAPGGGFDVIVCRGVLDGMEGAARHRAMLRLDGALAADGVLFADERPLLVNSAG